MEIEIMFDKFYAVDIDGETELYPSAYFYYNLDDPTNDNVELITGWFGRLSMPGYLDCTGWVGPFDSEQEVNWELTALYSLDD